ncbi:MAG TPA: hypothetical protein VGA69_09655 [Nitriliruptorales bacterium]
MASSRQRDWARRYPPLASALVAALVVAFVLPSALSVPQSNPTQTLEFAPIPPEDDTPPPPTSGDLSTLSLGSTSTTPGADAPGDGPVQAPPPPPPPGIGTRPTTFRCVGNPPRQTEDPLSPPCVAHFEGDNGGATHAGVTEEEVRILVHVDANEFGVSGTSRGNERPPRHGVFDLDREQSDYLWFRLVRIAERILNTRYQLYGRRAHFFVQVGEILAQPEVRRAEAAEGLAEADPFAVISFASGGVDAYLEEFARNDRVAFLAIPAENVTAGASAEKFRRYPGRLWGFNPSIEQRAATMVDYGCSVMVGSPVSFTGVAEDMGDSRRLGMVIVGDPAVSPDFGIFSDRVIAGLEECGAEIVYTATNQQHCWNQEFRPCPEHVTQEVVRLQAAGTTTVVMVENGDYSFMDAAERIGWFPEFMLLSSGTTESSNGAKDSARASPGIWNHVRAVSTFTLTPDDLDDRICFRAAKEAAPDHADRDLHLWWCGVYPDLRMLFFALQVAGPELSPQTIDQGFHAIPAVRSPDVRVPACYYLPGDYTCVKDATVAWFDDGGHTPGDRGNQGCWRLMDGGARYIRGTWPDRNVDDRRDPGNDPCTLFGAPDLTTT